MGDGSKVDISALSKFGSDTNDSLQTYQKGLGAPLGMIMKGEVGGSALGTEESQTFNDCYNQYVCDPTTTFSTQDSVKGIMALGFGAIVQAANYTEGDQSQRQAMNGVLDMFTQDPSKGLDADLANNDKDVTGKTKVVQLPAPNTADDVNNNVCRADAQTPMEQLQAHNNKYGKWETWQPPDPNAQPDPIYSEPLGPGMI
jgi:hypothetical protein